MNLIGRILATTSLIEVPLAVALGIRGYPFIDFPWACLGFEIFWWEKVVAAIHAPGIALLSIAGLCCGYLGGPIGDDYVAGHAPLSVSGVLILALANIVVWSFAAYLISQTIRVVWKPRS